MPACAHVCRLFRSAIEVGFFTPLAIRTPWFASKYGRREADHLRALRRDRRLLDREVVRLLPGEQDCRERRAQEGDLVFGMPSCVATSRARPNSKPDGFLIVVPDAWPFQKAGRRKVEADDELSGVQRRHARRRRGGGRVAAAATAAAAGGQNAGDSHDPDQREKTLHGLPSYLETGERARLYSVSAAAVRAWKWPISCSLRPISTPWSSAPEPTPRWTVSTSARSSFPTWSSNARRSSIQAVVDVRAEEVVEEAMGALGRARHDRADRDVGPATEDVDPEIRPEEVELRARQLALRRRRSQRAVLGREAAVARELVRVGRDVDHLAEAGVRDLAVVALEEVLADDLPVRLDLGLPAGVVDERVDVEAELCDLGGQRAECLRERLPTGVAFTKTKGPHVSTATGRRPSSSCGKSGSSSLRGAARSRPSRPYVHAWYGHCSVSRLLLAVGDDRGLGGGRR